MSVHMSEDAFEKDMQQAFETALSALNRPTGTQTILFFRTISSFLRKNEELSWMLLPLLRVAVKLFENKNLMKSMAQFHKLQAAMFENPVHRVQNLVVLRAMVVALENETVCSSLGNAVRAANAAMEDEKVHQRVDQWLQSEQGQMVSSKSIELAQAVMENEEIQGTIEYSLKLATMMFSSQTAVAESILSTKLAQSATETASILARSPTLQRGMELAEYLVSSSPVKSTATGVVNASIKVATHPIITNMMMKSTSVTLNIASSAAVKSSFQKTSSVAANTWSYLTVNPWTFANQRSLEDLKTSETSYQVEMNSLDKELDILQIQAEKLRRKLGPILVKLQDRGHRKQAILKRLDAIRADILHLHEETIVGEKVVITNCAS